jgi:PIN domain nuclease of toxin-antitoxin system
LIRVVADTHALVWAIFNDPRLSTVARDAIIQTLADGDEIGVATITLVELVYLVEKAELPGEVLDRVLLQLRDPQSALIAVPLTDAVAEAMRTIPRSDVPDMPDRIIAATAVYLDVPLISRDSKIRVSAVPTIW